MKKILYYLSMCLLLSGCSLLSGSEIVENGQQNDLKIRVTSTPVSDVADFNVKEISSSGMMVEVINLSDKTLSYGESYRIERKNGNTWDTMEKIAKIGNLYSFSDAGYFIYKTVVISIDWSELYGQLSKGEYRIVLSSIIFWDENFVGKMETAITLPAIEFVIE